MIQLTEKELAILKKAESAGDGFKVEKKASGLGKIQDINIKNFEIKNKHLNSSTAKRARKFNVSSAEEANNIVQDSLKMCGLPTLFQNLK